MNLGRLKFIVTSRPFTAMLMLYLWLSLPDYSREWIDSYETRDGDRHIYETTFTGDPSRFEILFGDYQDLAYAVLNALMLMFVLYAYYLIRHSYKCPRLLDLQMDVVGIISFPVLFLFNPIDPLIRYLPPGWALIIKTFYLVCLGFWFLFFSEIKRSYRAHGIHFSQPVHHDNP